MYKTQIFQRIEINGGKSNQLLRINISLNTLESSFMEKRVAIIGAGISGLVACKHLASAGLRPLVFESAAGIGGVWNRTMACTRLQSEKEFYCFSDFPWPSSVPDLFPKNTQILDYIHSYAHHFDLFQYIHFNSTVTRIEYVGEDMPLWNSSGKAFASNGKWILHVLQQNSTKEYVFEFVVLCIGRFSGLADIPKFPPGCGPEVFTGEVLHSMDYTAMDHTDAARLIKGKRVAIIGSGKSAIDLAFECANANGNEKPCTVIQRSIHWMFLDAHAWGVPFSFLCFTRLGELMLHKPGESFFSSLLATLLSPMRWGLSKFVESNLKWRFPLKKHNMIPKESLIQEVSSCQILFLPSENFYDKVEDGSIVLKRSNQIRFYKQGLIIDDTTKVEADLVVFATGFKGDEKLKNIFASPTFRNIISGSPDSIVPLYRQMIHPRIPQLAVIGYSESLANLYTSELRSKWLAFFLDEAFSLPSVKEMEEEIEEMEKFLKKYSGNGQFRRSCIASAQIWYNDQLCKDMGFNPNRKKGVLLNLIQPYVPSDYIDIDPAH